MNISAVAAELFHAEGRTDRLVGWQTDRKTDMSNLIVTFCNSANALKNWQEVNIKFLVTVKINVVQTFNL